MFTRVISVLLVLNILVKAKEEMNDLKLNMREDKPPYCREVGYLCGNNIKCCPGLNCVTETFTTTICDVPPISLSNGSLRLLASWRLFGALMLMTWTI